MVRVRRVGTVDSVGSVRRPSVLLAAALAVVAAAVSLVVVLNEQAATQPTSPAARCSQHHGFGAEPVDVAKSADGRVVLAQVRWGYQADINLCYLVLDDAAVEVLRASLPQGAPMWSSGEVDEAAAQRCSRHHNVMETPVDVAKSADGRAVLAQVRWGYRADGNLCYLLLNDMALEALRAAAQPSAAARCSQHHGFGAEPVDVAKSADGRAVLAQVRWGYQADINLCYLVLDDAAVEVLRASLPQGAPMWSSGEVDEAAAQRCSRHHNVMETPVDVAKSADGRAVLAQVRWGYRADGNLCYLLLNDMALEALRAAAQPPPRLIILREDYGCGLRVDKTIACWGDNRAGQASAPPGQFVRFYAGGDSSAVPGYWCGLRTNAAAVCWGDNRAGQASSPPGRFSQLYLRDDFACGLRADQTLLCWGDSRDEAWQPAQGRFARVSIADSRGCGLQADQTVACWGDIASPPPGRFSQLYLRGDFACGLNIDQTVACWGNNRSGQASPPPGRFSQLYLRGDFACGLNIDQTVACWGDNRVGQTDTPSGEFNSVILAEDYGCGLTTDRAAVCWGDNTAGQASAPQNQQFLRIFLKEDFVCGLRAIEVIACWGDIAATPGGQFSRIYLADYYGCGLRADQTVACWGDIASPPGGQFTRVYLDPWEQRYGCGLRADKTIACWGDNSHGQTSPPAGQFTDLFLNARYGCGLRADKTIACWGDNSHGQTNTPDGQFA